MFQANGMYEAQRGTAIARGSMQTTCKWGTLLESEKKCESGFVQKYARLLDVVLMGISVYTNAHYSMHAWHHLKDLTHVPHGAHHGMSHHYVRRHTAIIRNLSYCNPVS